MTAGDVSTLAPARSGGGRLEALAESLAGHGLILRALLPRNRDHLLVLAVGPEGEVTSGQWFAAPGRAEVVAARTPGADVVAHAVTYAVTYAGGGGLVMQPGGVDRRLPRLGPLAAAPGCRLVAHRPERRGVVQRPGSFVKVVRGGTAADVVARAPRPGSCGGFEVPAVLRWDDDDGVVETEALPGRSLYELLGGGDVAASLDDGSSSLAVDTLSLVDSALAVGSALAELHRQPGPPDVVHDAVAELGVLRRWLGHAADHGVLERHRPQVERAERHVATTLTGLGHRPTGLIHRDLHDKQLLLAAGRRPGLLDFDLAAGGDPALDVANLLVHLELRVAQGRCTASRAREVATALLTGYDVDTVSSAALQAYADATRLRLAAVYAFRPHSRDLPAALLGAVGEPVLGVG